MGFRNQVSLLLVFPFLVLSIAQAKVEAVIGGVSPDQNPNMAFALPDTVNSEILISRDQYLISYNKNRRAPNWVAWKLQASSIGNSGRSNKFRADPDLQTYLAQNDSQFTAVAGTDYTNSCFDRGHQIPSGDRTDNATDNEATFVMSNMIPQTPFLNRVIWEHFETYTRDLVQSQGKTVFVVAGPIYDQDFGSIGPARDIPIPSKDFKIIFILDAGQDASSITQSTPSIAVIMPNILKNGQIPQPYVANCGDTDSATGNQQLSNDDWKQYQTTIADVESKSGFSFGMPQAAVKHKTKKHRR
jgi:endonuclease G